MLSLHHSTWNQSWPSASLTSKIRPHGWSALTIGGECRGSNPSIVELLLEPQAAARFWTKAAGSRDAAVKTGNVVEVGRDLHSLWENEKILREKFQDVKDFVVLLSTCSSDSIWHILSRKGGHDVTLGLSRCSRLWALFLRGSGEDPVVTSGDLGSEGFTSLACCHVTALFKKTLCYLVLCSTMSLLDNNHIVIHLWHNALADHNRWSTPPTPSSQPPPTQLLF